MQLMTQAEFARHRGVTKGAVSNWKAAKLLVLVEEPGTGRIKVDVHRSDAKLNAKLDPMRGRPPTAVAAPSAPVAAADPVPGLPLEQAAASDDIASERLQHLREQRVGQAMKNGQLAGELVALTEATQRVSEAGRAMRERVQAWARGAAEELAAATDPRTVMIICEEGLDQVFDELARAAARGDFAGMDDEDPPLSAEEEAEMEAAAEAE